MALLVAFFLVIYGPLAFGPGAPNFLATEYPVLWLPVKGVQFLGEACLVLFFCLFPSRRFVPRWDRWLALAYLAAQAPILLFPGSPLDWVSQFGSDQRPCRLRPSTPDLWRYRSTGTGGYLGWPNASRLSPYPETVILEKMS